MRIIATREALLALVTRAAAGASRDKNKPILGALRLDACAPRLSVLGMDVGHSVEVSGPVNVEQPGAVALAADTLVAALKAADCDTVTLATTGKAGRVTLTGRGVSYTLNTLDASDFPEPPAVDGVAFTVAGSALANVLGCVKASIAPPDNRYGLSGAHMEDASGKLRLVATDGNRLAWAECEVKGEVKAPRRAILPGTAVPLILSACGAADVVVTLADRAAEVRTEDTTIRVRLLEADFPDYRQVLPSSFKRRVLVDRDAIAGALRRVAFVESNVRLSVGDSGLTLSTRSIDRGEASAEVDADVTGEAMTMGISARFALDALAPMPAGRVVVELGDALSPVRLVSEAVGGAAWIVMPVRLD